MPRYLIHSPEHFPSVFDAVKAIGDVDADMPAFIVLSTDRDIDAVAALVREAAGENNCIIAEVTAARYGGDGRAAKIAEFLDADGRAAAVA